MLTKRTSSLLSFSAGVRLMLAGLLVVCLWGAICWAVALP